MMIIYANLIIVFLKLSILYGFLGLPRFQLTADSTTLLGKIKFHVCINLHNPKGIH